MICPMKRLADGRGLGGKFIQGVADEWMSGCPHATMEKYDVLYVRVHEVQQQMHCFLGTASSRIRAHAMPATVHWQWVPMHNPINVQMA
jgi:hypothetical protein